MEKGFPKGEKQGRVRRNMEGEGKKTAKKSVESTTSEATTSPMWQGKSKEKGGGGQTTREYQGWAAKAGY